MELPTQGISCFVPILVRRYIEMKGKGPFLINNYQFLVRGSAVVGTVSFVTNLNKHCSLSSFLIDYSHLLLFDLKDKEFGIQTFIVGGHNLFKKQPPVPSSVILVSFLFFHSLSSTQCPQDQWLSVMTVSEFHGETCLDIKHLPNPPVHEHTPGLKDSSLPRFTSLLRETFCFHDGRLQI